MSCFRIPDHVLSEIQSLTASYWWGDSSDKRKIHWCSWEKLSRCKAHGGLGFRHLRSFNLALLAKQAWRILTSPHSLLARILKEKYFPNGDLLHASLGHRPSWSWRSIFDSLPIVRLGCRKLIRSGLNTKIWIDPWLPRPPDFLVRSPVTTLSPSVSVSALIECGIWNESLVREVFSNEEAHMILSLPLSSSSAHDLWIWHHTKNGKFSVRSAYHTCLASDLSHLTSSISAGSSSGHNPLWKRIWKLRLPPRFQHFLWRCCTDSLPTPENLARRGLLNNVGCTLCHSETVSATHIFFHCPFAAHIWSSAGIRELIMNFLQPNFSLWMQDLVLSQSHQIIELAATICNLLWYHRNKHNHELNYSLPDPHSIAAAAFCLLHDYHSANSWPERLVPELVNHPLVSRSIQEPRICFDGALYCEQKRAGVGVVVLDGENGFTHGISKSFANVDNPEMAEFLALREALFLADKLNLSHLPIFGDAAAVVLAANGDADCLASCYPILTDIFRLRASLDNIRIFWFRRSQNNLAHELASFAKFKSLCDYSWTSMPDFLCHSSLDVFQHI